MLSWEKKTVSANSLVDMFTNIAEAPVCRQFGDDIVNPLYNPIVVALRGLPTSHLWDMITAPLKHSQIWKPISFIKKEQEQKLFIIQLRWLESPGASST